MPSWEKGQHSRKTKPGYALEVTYRCLLPTDRAASEFIRTKSSVSCKGKRSSEQQYLNLTETRHSRDGKSLFLMILRKRLWTLAVPRCLADEAAVSHGRAAHREVLLPDFPCGLITDQFLKNKQPVTELLSAVCCYYINKIFHYGCILK